MPNPCGMPQEMLGNQCLCWWALVYLRRMPSGVVAPRRVRLPRSRHILAPLLARRRCCTDVIFPTRLLAARARMFEAAIFQITVRTHGVSLFIRGVVFHWCSGFTSPILWLWRRQAQSAAAAHPPPETGKKMLCQKSSAPLRTSARIIAVPTCFQRRFRQRFSALAAKSSCPDEGLGSQAAAGRSS